MSANKGRRNYRSKADNSDEEFLYEPESLYEQGSKEVICGPAVAVSSSCGTMKKTRSVLSFEDDLDPDDGAMFKVKKTNLSRRVGKQDKEQHKKKKPIDDDMPKLVSKKEPIKTPVSQEDPVESERKLECLRRQLLDLAEDDGPSTTLPKPETPGISSLVKSKFVYFISQMFHTRRLNSRRSHYPSSQKAAEEDDDDEDDFDDAGPSSAYATAGSERRPAFVVSDERDTVIKRPLISSRLNRREAELDSIRRNFLAAEHASDRDSDEDTEWEKQQIQKALITQNPAALEAVEPLERREDSRDGSKSGPLFAGLDANSLTVANLKSIFQERFHTLSTSLSTHQAALEAARTDLDRGKKVMTDCRDKLPQLARKFAFVKEMKDYIDDLVECFNEKMSKIEYMERRTIILYRERYNKLTERRRLDMKDLADLATQPATSSVQSAVKAPEETKQFEARRRRAAEREARRIRRQRARDLAAQASNQHPAVSHVDGTSTDDEEPQAVIAKRKADIDALLVDATALFEDVVEEFCDLPLILSRFSRWHSDFPESYAEAYASLCLPQLFAPIIRLQLIGWNPIAQTCDPLEAMSWFSDLLDFSCLPIDGVKLEPRAKEGGDACTLNPDLKVLPLTVEKVLLERLNELVEAAWDPLSRRESERLVALMKDLTTNYPSVRVGSRPTEQLFTTIVKRLEVTVQEDIFIPLYSRHVMQSRQSAAFQFFERQLRIGIKMLKNILLWHGLISTEALQHVSLTCLVNRYLLVGLASLMCAATLTTTSTEEKNSAPFSLLNNFNPLQTATLTFQDCVDRLTEIVEALPKEWISASSLPQHTDNKIDIHTPEETQRNDKSSPGALSQLRRFVSQLMEHSFLSPDGSRQGTSQLERCRELENN
ncbi:GC-rich sequence DNA-binding factor-like protein [Opisthorchis viverrini]|uniref:GC-rich sequence DNA-binding factor-like protein n=1 Tax=Opisthorchis viverrini TaxID=6198 RepID=A0A1S8X4Q8_OPIVI|nr:GC-rich sequence DNA-binding factor-like protein [Opisthorchis viverrini]